MATCSRPSNAWCRRGLDILPSTVHRGLKWTGLAVLAALVAVQFVPVERTNPPVDPALAIERHLPVPAEVKAILDRSCRNCHTNQTEWPLYSYVAPLSWDIVNHVNHAREEMNFSEWGTYDSDTAQDNLIALCRQVRSGEMPLPSVHAHPPLGAPESGRRHAAVRVGVSDTQEAPGGRVGVRLWDAGVRPRTAARP